MEMAVMPLIAQGAVVVLIRTKELVHRLFDGGDSAEKSVKLTRLCVFEDVNGAIPLESEIAPTKILLAFMQKENPVLKVKDAELLIRREVRHIVHLSLIEDTIFS